MFSYITCVELILYGRVLDNNNNNNNIDITYNNNGDNIYNIMGNERIENGS